MTSRGQLKLGVHIPHIRAGLVRGTSCDGHNLPHCHANVPRLVGAKAILVGRSVRLVPRIHIPKPQAHGRDVPQKRCWIFCFRPALEIAEPVLGQSHLHRLSGKGFLDVLRSASEDVGQIQGPSTVASIEDTCEPATAGQRSHQRLKQLAVHQHARLLHIHGAKRLMPFPPAIRAGLATAVPGIVQEQRVPWRGPRHQPGDGRHDVGLRRALGTGPVRRVQQDTAVVIVFWEAPTVDQRHDAMHIIHAAVQLVLRPVVVDADKQALAPASQLRRRLGLAGLRGLALFGDLLGTGIGLQGDGGLRLRRDGCSTWNRCAGNQSAVVVSASVQRLLLTLHLHDLWNHDAGWEIQWLRLDALTQVV
mmetsp:Transcript_119075/g.282524  ORF Transcript_119075/g.282524 Transcript_119075/m.282524 type:complete len:362 (+) Transcript_119075:366-1451(+)